ncbi:16S rRNA (guanine(966)-N(2))-methyltransferase RsmD [Calidifontibacter sp. DB0510]|uniref:16S rRNA (Guanine(966)-N(2))-methyltransferase RsmD n=1 Tax=Metallococcus carri TaxID=1656884 RepID=A0A967EFZ3_9MICO|nr:16S rRNA (guanine(966)-N(2))-methyltransferase RsmD [Metallococcus carri]NHN54468.1 16S rRNA (guanine(966)-N(2))-methyltransferase RsmD [Metallococcus carri]NOP36693.1 16S rRNA (guanine(966)-N(2))-methyltransferase RsmD [Calidifontibacter sp. DB2511S]
MTRIIAGTAGGRRIATPPGSGTRPTSDRVRESLFARLQFLEAIEDATVLDLYAGSGALGLEAASRGASRVVLVERDRRAADVCRRNARELALPQVEVRAEKVERFLEGDGGPAYDLVFLDPPYDLADHTLAAVLERLVGRLAEDAVVIVERSSRSPEPVWPVGIEVLGPRAYGETTIWYAEYLPEGEIA